MALSKTEKRNKIKRRVRRNIFGTAQKPRLSVYRSNKEIYAQLINDDSGETIASASSRDKALKATGTKTEIATEVGKLIGERAKEKGVELIVFDRNGFVYHGRIKALADGAREVGLKF